MSRCTDRFQQIDFTVIAFIDGICVPNTCSERKKPSKTFYQIGEEGKAILFITLLSTNMTLKNAITPKKTNLET